MGSGRLATGRDISRLIDMTEELAKSVNGPQEVDRIITGNSFMSHIVEPRAVVFITDGGFISGRIITTVINAEPVAFETGWYAWDRTGISLLRQFENWSIEQGAAMTVMSCNGGLAQKLLERCGYKLAEMKMVKRWQYSAA